MAQRRRRARGSASQAAGFVLGSVACGASTRGSDAALQDVASQDAALVDAPSPLAEAGADASDAGGYCADGAQRWMELNGVGVSTAAVSAAPLFLNCCEAGEFRFLSARFAEALVVQWRAQAFPMPATPVTLDLAHLPQGWSVTVSAGCPATGTGCVPSDQFTEGLTGTLTLTRTASDGSFAGSVCVAFEESSAQPHANIHRFRLSSGAVQTP